MKSGNMPGIALSIIVAVACLMSMPDLHGMTHPVVAMPDSITESTDSMTRDLQEVVVKANPIKHQGNHTIVTITREMRKNASNAFEMLGNIPGMYVNRASGAMEYNGRGKIKLLVDSLEKDEKYIKNLTHIRYDRVDIIRNPTGRYAEYDVVINLHTRENYEGYDLNLNSDIIFRPEYRKGYAFSESNPYENFTYTRNKWNFAVNSGFDYNRNESSSYSTTDYLTNNLQETSIKNPGNAPTKRSYFRNVWYDLSIDYQFTKNHVLSFRWFLASQDAETFNKKTIATGPLNTPPADTIGYKNMFRDKGYRHTWGLYYNGKIKGWGIWMGANYSHNPWRVWNHTDRSSGFEVNDNMRQQLNFTWATADISKGFIDGKLSLNFGYENMWRKYSARRMETGEKLSSAVDRRNRWYASVTYRPGSSTYIRANGGMTFNDNSIDKVHEHQTLYNLGLSLTQDFNNGYASLYFNRSISNPLAQTRRDYGQFTDSLMWSGGNPKLKSSASNYLSLSLNWKGFFAGGSMDISPDAICNIIEQREGLLPNGLVGPYLASQPQNVYSRSVRTYLGYSGKIKSIQIYANLSWNEYYSSYKDFSNHESGPDLIMNISKNFSRSNATAYFEYKINSSTSALPQSYSNGYTDDMSIFLQKNWMNNKLTLLVEYTLPLHFTKCRNHSWTSTPALWQHTYSNDQALVDNRIMIVLRLLLTGGKSVRQYNRSLFGGN